MYIIIWLLCSVAAFLFFQKQMTCLLWTDKISLAVCLGLGWPIAVPIWLWTCRTEIQGLKRDMQIRESLIESLTIEYMLNRKQW